VILIGGKLNAEIEHQTARDSTEGPDKPIGTRRAQMADTVGGVGLTLNLMMGAHTFTLAHIEICRPISTTASGGNRK
jgi:hypothetical protein